MKKQATILLIVLFTTIPTLITIAPASAVNQIDVSERPKENTLTPMAPMPTARFYLKVVVVEGRIYALGGYNAESKVLTVNEMYDPQTNTWTKKAPIPTPRGNFAIAVYDDKIYCIGGKSRGAVYNGINDWQYFRVNEVYDPATDTWENKAPLPTARTEINAAVADGLIYVIGGNPNASLNEAYDLKTDSWSTKAAIQYYKEPNLTPFTVTSSNSYSNYATVVTVNEDIFYVSKMANGTGLLLQYNPTNDTWTAKTSPEVYFPLLAFATEGTYAPKQIYTTGANSGVYDLATDKWSSASDRHLGGYEGSAFAVVDDKIYCLGGRYINWRVVAPSFAVPEEEVISNGNKMYIPFGYGTVPPLMSILTPQSGTSVSGNVTFNVLLNKPSQITYKLDGQNNVTVTGNFTISALSWGSHTVTIYATDSFGNISESTVNFTIEAELFTITILVAIAAITVLVTTIIVISIKKVAKQTKKSAPSILEPKS